MALPVLGSLALILLALSPAAVEAQFSDRIRDSYKRHKARASCAVENGAVRAVDSTLEKGNRGVETTVDAAGQLVDTALNRVEDAVSRAFEGGKGDADAFARALASGSLVLRGIEFAPSSDELSPESNQLLERLAKAVRATPGIFLIEGHMDPLGDPAVRQALSAQRAAAVKVRLIAQGVPASRLFAVGHGATRPPAPTTDGKARSASPARIELTKISS